MYVCEGRQNQQLRETESLLHIYTVGLLYVFYTIFELALKLTIHVIQNLVCNETLVVTKFKL